MAPTYTQTSHTSIKPISFQPTSTFSLQPPSDAPLPKCLFERNFNSTLLYQHANPRRFDPDKLLCNLQVGCPVNGGVQARGAQLGMQAVEPQLDPCLAPTPASLTSCPPQPALETTSLFRVTCYYPNHTLVQAELCVQYRDRSYIAGTPGS